MSHFRLRSLKIRLRQIVLVVVVAAIAGFGVYILGSSHAASPYISNEAEAGNLSGAATTRDDAAASSSHFVQFGTSGTSSFVQVCGLQLCLNGKPFVIHGATAYGTYDDPASEVALAQQTKVNVLEAVEFDTQYHTLSDVMSSATWTRLDKFIAAADQAGLHVILNLSEYGQSLQAAGQTPTTTDWENYVSFIANRTNSVTGVQYKNDPTIAMVEIFGEIDAPNYVIHPGTEGTTAEMTSFYQRTMSEWKTLAPNILVSTGGFSYINDPNSGIDWKTIVNDPNNAACDVEVNSSDDETVSVPELTSYCKGLNRPWFLAAWSSCYQPSGQTYGFYTTTDAQMAAHAQDMYNVEVGKSEATYAAIGSDFWNLQNQGTQAGTCSLSPSFPQTFAVIQDGVPTQ